jgi:hypothetical protein
MPRYPYPDLIKDTTPQLGGTLDSNAHQIRWAKGVDVPSANALVLGTDGNYFDITGVTAITSIGTLAAGTVVCLHFDGILTLTHHATDLILPGAANITTAAGDEAIFVEYAAGDWRCINYSRADGTSIRVLIHTDTAHTGSAARNIASGVAGLNADGAVQPPTLAYSQYIGLGAAGEGGSIYFGATGSVFLCNNCYYNGYFYRIDIAREANILEIHNTGTLLRHRASAGANPIVWGLMSDVVISSATGSFAGLLNADNAPHWVAVPASAASAGNAGEIAYDASYFYVCVANATWRRVAIATW